MPFVLPMLSTVIVFSVLLLGAVVVNQQRQSKLVATPSPNPSLQDVLCDCILREFCGTLNSGSTSIQAQSCGDGEDKICCPIQFEPRSNITSKGEILTSSLKEKTSVPTSIGDLDFPYSTDEDEAKKAGIILKLKNTEPENVDFDYGDETERAVSPKFPKAQPATENQVSFKAHENFKLLPSWKECGLTGVVSEKNNHQITFDDYPWTVQIGFKTDAGEVQYKCMGTLINQKYVLVAAHCNKNGIPSEVLIKISHGSPDYKFARFEVKKSIPHHLYKNGTLENDISLLRLAVPSNMKELGLQPTCLPFSSEYGFPGEEFTDNSMLVGFSPDTTNEAVSITQNIKGFPVRITATAECDTLLELRNSSNSNGFQLCAELTQTPSTNRCKDEEIEGSIYSHMEDKAPHKYIHIGISTVSMACSGNTPAIFTRVSKYLEWILDSIEP